MTTWTPEQIDAIRAIDDFHISPYRGDGTTPGTPGSGRSSSTATCTCAPTMAPPRAATVRVDHAPHVD
ncbi:hypothetical protein [Brachybacterium hainanense]|uniref:Uncharacterized protein n=1 Tax=Brachybacterium hainanense TaxID=1541174 RepID=A0ABV6RFR2_9MICO